MPWNAWGRKMKISLIATVMNEEESIDGFLESILSQSRRPDEVVLVDGGSVDRTVQRIQSYLGGEVPIRLFVQRGCNISEGRNRAVREARHDVIAVTDAGCTLDPEWLRELSQPMEQDTGIDVVAGIYKVVWKRAGGYPEWLRHAEDSYFSMQLTRLGCRFHFSPNAVVRWRPRGGPVAFFRQYFRYAAGDGRAHLFKRHYVPKILAVLLAAVLVVDGNVKALLVLVVLYLTLIMLRFWSRGRSRGLVCLLPPVVLLHDVAQVTGYLVGMMLGGRKA
jgi:glycosyltransferase involved in cell wall biosynthesis